MIAKLVKIAPITIVHGTYHELVTGAYLNQLLNHLWYFFMAHFGTLTLLQPTTDSHSPAWRIRP
jgi:hypothetical protein